MSLVAVSKASGSFIQGWLAGTYTDDQWSNEFGFMKDAGIQKLIVQSTVDESSQQTTPPSYSPTSMVSLYPSQIHGMTYRGNTPGALISPVESILKHAQANNVSVYLGLNFYGTAWFYNFNNRPFVTDTNWGALEAARGNTIADELSSLYRAKYPNAFAGWYWPWEIDNSAALLLPSTQTALAKMMNANFNHLATIGGGLPVIISPFFNPLLSTPAQGESFWKAMFAQLPGFGAKGIFAPQDGIGAGDVTLSQIPAWFGALAGAVASRPGLKFWANCETFQHVGNANYSAPMSRVVQQFQAVGPSVSDIVTFAYSHYDSPQQADPSLQAEWVQYYKTGQLPPQSEL